MSYALFKREYLALFWYSERVVDRLPLTYDLWLKAESRSLNFEIKKKIIQ